jgi:hypothetical protein
MSSFRVGVLCSALCLGLHVSECAVAQSKKFDSPGKTPVGLHYRESLETLSALPLQSVATRSS